MIKSKKADVNWVVVGFVLALIVLAILAYIFYTQSKKSSDVAIGITKCEARGGKCWSESDKSDKGTCFYQLGCPAEKPYCCILEEKT